ncbi:hypothetical protein EV652_10394 [Kribbella steppae]|uniref:Uncharacterized protein n=1 Tax=Kribbella steppae TaxID=2512223 RepID=A0A4R2HSZ1_9ACTN|nr:hypothetical protein [Kribbella steppae]TCO33095.1 hypothetical protein EV652_10394 [Kribbella steppae]
MDTDAAIVELFGLPPEQFIGARNQLARVVRDAGDVRAAAMIAALRKPTVSAWLANQLVRADPDGIHALTQLGEQLRETYLSSDSARRRELTRERHDLVRNLVRIARDQAAGGRQIAPQTAERLAETLDAALVDPAAAQLLRTGQLTSALRHVGFGVVDESGDPARLAPMRPRVVRRPEPPRKSAKPKVTQRATAPSAGRSPIDRTLEQRRAAQQKRRDQAEADYSQAEADRVHAEELLDAHQHRIDDLEADLARLNEQLEQIRQTLREARRQTARLQRAFSQAARNAAAVRKRRDTEEQRLSALD